MPTYEYACKECGEHLEVQQSFSDPSLTECPACGGPLRKVFGSIGIAFKGSGFYKTDSRSKASTTSTPSSPKEPATTADSPAPAPAPAAATDTGGSKAAPAAPPTSAAAKAD